MLGDAPSLLEHLDSILENNQLAKRSLTVRPRVTAYYGDRFVRVPIPSLSPIIPFVYRDLPFYLVFPLSFFPGCLYLLRLAPADDAAGMVPFPSEFQRDGSYIPSGLSGRETWPCARKKKSFFSIFFSLHDLDFIGVWASRLNVPFLFWTPTR
jgi:hypothetical protein